jgi:hypothetical protein
MQQQRERERERSSKSEKTLKKGFFSEVKVRILKVVKQLTVSFISFSW